MVVDDDFFNRMALSLVLKVSGVDVTSQVEEAENGLIAYNKIVENPQSFKMIFMDVTMPVMDGLVSTKKIKAHYNS